MDETAQATIQTAIDEIAIKTETRNNQIRDFESRIEALTAEQEVDQAQMDSLTALLPV